MNDKKLNTIINSLDNEKIPNAPTIEEQEYSVLIQSLKSANPNNLEPDIQFINQLELKLMKGDSMLNKIQNYFKLPYIASFAVVVLLIIGVTSSYSIPTPLDLMRGGMHQSDITIGNPGMGTFNNNKSYEMLDQLESSSPSVGPDSYMAIEPDIASIPPFYGDDVITSDRSIVSSADLNIEVEDVKTTVDEVVQYVESVNGYITNSSLNKTEKGYYAYQTIKVPSESFQAAIQNFRRMGLEVTYENVNSYDQTRQVVDTNDQLEELKSQLVEYQLLLEEAQTTQEKIRLQQQISNLERQIKNMERSAQNLEARELMSTINLTIQEKRFSIPFLENLGLEYIFQDAVQTLVKLVAMVVVIMIWVLVLAPIWLPIWLVTRFIKNKKK